MTRRRGNPKWSLQYFPPDYPQTACAWEECLKLLKLSERDALSLLREGSTVPEIRALKEWIRSNCRRKYLPMEVIEILKIDQAEFNLW